MMLHFLAKEKHLFCYPTWLRYVWVFAVANPSVIVCNVGAPFSNISSPLCTLAILWPSCKILWRSSQGNPSIWGLKRKRSSNRAMVDLSKAISHTNVTFVRVSHLHDEFLVVSVGRRKLSCLQWSKMRSRLFLHSGATRPGKLVF